MLVFHRYQFKINIQLTKLLQTQTRGCGTESCNAISCMPLYSTGCAKQGHINDELLPQKNNIDFHVTETVNEREESSLAAPPPVKPTLSPFPPLDYLASLARPPLGSIPYGQVITSCTVPGTIALTFDDGPWKYTSDLLDLLQREGAHATFFVCGGNFAPDQLTGYGHPRILRRMISAGHQIGSHTWAHPDLGGLAEDEVMRQMWLNEQTLVGVLGMLPTYFRPPYLSWAQATLGIMAKLGYHFTTLDYETDDWRGDYEASKQNFRAKVEQSNSQTDSMIVLAHDIHERTVYELAEFMIDLAKEHGYKLVTVGECLGDPIKNWYRNPYDGGSWKRGEDRQSNEVVRRHIEPKIGHAEEAWKQQLHYHTVSPPPPGVESRNIVMSLKRKHEHPVGTETPLSTTHGHNDTTRRPIPSHNRHRPHRIYDEVEELVHSITTTTGAERRRLTATGGVASLQPSIFPTGVTLSLVMLFVLW